MNDENKGYEIQKMRHEACAVDKYSQKTEFFETTHLQLAAQQLTRDAAAITLYGERVAYVVVYGPPAARLCDCVMPPLEVVAFFTPNL